MQQPSYFAATDDVAVTNPTLSMEEAARNSADLEGTAEQVLHAKQLLIDLDRRKNQIREGIRALKNKQKDDTGIHSSTSEDVFKLCRAVRAAKGGPPEEELRKDMLAAGCKANTKLGDYRDGLIADFIGLPRTAAAGAVQDVTGEPAKPHSKKMWLLCSGGAFIRSDAARSMNKLLKDQYDTDSMIEETRDELKRLTTELAHLEGPDSALARLNAGMNLRDPSKPRE